jgi:hypothetical protein
MQVFVFGLNPKEVGTMDPEVAEETLIRLCHATNTDLPRQLAGRFPFEPLHDDSDNQVHTLCYDRFPQSKFITHYLTRVNVQEPNLTQPSLGPSQIPLTQPSAPQSAAADIPSTSTVHPHHTAIPLYLYLNRSSSQS